MYIKRAFDSANTQADDPLSRFFNQHHIRDNMFDSFEAAETFFKEQGFRIDAEAAPDFTKLSALPQVMKLSTPAQLEAFQAAGPMQKTWRLTLGLILFLLLGTGMLSSCHDSEDPPPAQVTAPAAPAVPDIDFKVVRTFPHDSTLFTEGLVVHDGQLFESTGSPGDLPAAKSLIGAIDLSTGKMQQKAELDRSKYFGEGIVFLKDKLYQLTYKTQTGFVYDAKSFKLLRTFTYANAEGWGMTTDGSALIMSDGSASLTFLNPESLTPVKTLAVTESGQPLEHINELEYINGAIYANVWQTNVIVKIDAGTGKVVGKINLSPIAFEAKAKQPASDVMNGIAYDAAGDKIYITGKLWSNIYQVSFAH